VSAVSAGPEYRRFLTRMSAVAGRGILLGLDRVNAALDALGRPEKSMCCVQVAGTNGKGSVCAMVEAMGLAAGLRVGLFSSPHLARFTERIRITGAEVDGERLGALLDRIDATGVSLTYFEISLLVALLAMVEDGVELAVLETGLGGRLDAVTAVGVQVTAITMIGLDHTQMLGPDLASIALEKAAIARPGVPMVVGTGNSPEVVQLLSAAAQRVGAPVVLPPSLQARGLGAIPLSLPGTHQRDNAAIACAIFDLVSRSLGLSLPAPIYEDGLSQAKWPGRCEWIGSVLFDGAHNPQGAAILAIFVNEMPVAARPTQILIGISADKDAAGILSALAGAFERIAVTMLGPRPMPIADLTDAASRAGFREILTVSDPIEWIAQAASARLRFAVAGSLFLVGPLRAALLGEVVDPF
jgi:dihydrofolate synthase / folylpolyglutamate synthase